MSSFHSLPTSNAPTPPQRGSFVLDHQGECKEFMLRYIECARKHKYFYEPCQDLSKEYLQCRMERDLMAKEDLSKLGFKVETPKS